MTATIAIPSRLWFQVCIHPRAVIREVLDRHQGSLWWLPLAFASGIAQTLLRGHNNNVGLRVPALWILLFAIPIGALWGLVQLYVFTSALYFVGNWSGSKATFRQLRSVCAWASAPQIAILLVWLLATAFFGRFLYISPAPQYGITLALGVVLVTLCTAIGGVWNLVILVQGLAEAQKISAAEAVFHVIGSVLVLAVAALVLLVPILLLLFRH